MLARGDKTGLKEDLELSIHAELKDDNGPVQQVPQSIDMTEGIVDEQDYQDVEIALEKTIKISKHI